MTIKMSEEMDEFKFDNYEAVDFVKEMKELKNAEEALDIIKNLQIRGCSCTNHEQGYKVTITHCNPHHNEYVLDETKIKTIGKGAQALYSLVFIKRTYLNHKAINLGYNFEAIKKCIEDGMNNKEIIDIIEKGNNQNG